MKLDTHITTDGEMTIVIQRDIYAARRWTLTTVYPEVDPTMQVHESYPLARAAMLGQWAEEYSHLPELESADDALVYLVKHGMVREMQVKLADNTTAE
ncbi:hypothetical protein [Chromobacterium sp. ASV23]|uniref:hypothetical protein n=1 Tax=Chromobacterium sp. ASV23 TaxID=2795110 RepID=UPI0018EBFA04|nr:hypothetical protein [Chromobacterium sp. ASV23]